MPDREPRLFKLDRSAFSVGRVEVEDSQVDYWLSQPPEMRIAAVEFLRGGADPDGYSAQRLRGILEVVERPCSFSAKNLNR
jgi:hypothetical protein